MSYILDALKRSEQERHQGQIPGFVDQNSLILMNRRQRAVWPYWVIGIVLINAGALFLIFQSTQEERAGFNSLASSADRPISKPGTEGRTESQRPLMGEPESQAAVNAAQTSAPPVISIKPQLNPALLSRSNNNETAAHEVPVQPKEATVVEPVATPALPQRNTPVMITPGNTANETVASPVVDAQPTVVVADAPLDEAPVYTPYADVSLLTELDARFQRSVPKLIFNSHIYSDNPEARRVMINNIYLREGQMFSGIQVKEIGEHSIVFEKQGRLFRLPVMRDWLG